MKFNQRRVLEAIKDSGGIKKNICAKLAVHRTTLDEWIAGNEAIAEAYRDEKEKLKDLADERLVEQIQMGNLGAIIWYQKTQCRDRGYSERVETAHSGEVSVTVTPDLSKLSVEELQQLERMLAKAGAEGDSQH
jgi:hypothetical protein